MLINTQKTQGTLTTFVIIAKAKKERNIKTVFPNLINKLWSE